MMINQLSAKAEEEEEKKAEAIGQNIERSLTEQSPGPLDRSNISNFYHLSTA